MLVFSPRFLHIPKSNYEIIKQFPFFNINTSSTYFLDKEKGKLFFHYMKVYTNALIEKNIIHQKY